MEIIIFGSFFVLSLIALAFNHLAKRTEQQRQSVSNLNFIKFQRRSSSSHVSMILESTNLQKNHQIFFVLFFYCIPLKNETWNFVKNICRFRIREKHVMNSLKVFLWSFSLPCLVIGYKGLTFTNCTLIMDTKNIKLPHFMSQDLLPGNWIVKHT